MAQGFYLIKKEQSTAWHVTSVLGSAYCFDFELHHKLTENCFPNDGTGSPNGKENEMETTHPQSEDNPQNVATYFDGSCKIPGWSNGKGIPTAIAENTFQISNVGFKLSTSCECEKKYKERKAQNRTN